MEGAQGPEAPAAVKARVEETYGKLPLHFEANQGQTDAQVKFLSRGSGYSLFLTPTEAVLVLKQQSAVSGQPSAVKTQDSRLISPPHTVGEGEGGGTILRLKLIGANPKPQVAGLEELPGKVNYFLGNDPTKWRTNIPTYAKVKYQEVYPGVDLVYYGNQRQLEYDLIVAPGADPKAITLAFEGLVGAGRCACPQEGDHRGSPLQIDAQGDLVLHLAGGQIRLQKPVVYQVVGGVKRPIPGHYVILPSPEVLPLPVGEGHSNSPLPVRAAPSNSPLPLGEGQGEGQGEGHYQVAFQIAAYDTSKPLVIDPTLSYSTYLGGSGRDEGFGIAVDSAGNSYMTGRTASTDFPTASPLQAVFGGGSFDTFVAKLNAAGSALVYSTYLGGSGDDFGMGIALDAEGSAYMTGFTASTNFPTTPGAFQAVNGGNGDVFVAKLNAAGSALVYSTYLGGSGEEGPCGVAPGSIALDASNNAYVTGGTASTDFPTANPIQAANNGGFDAFVTKLNATGSALVYATYLGGSASDGGCGIAVDSSGNVYVAGATDSGNFPTANPIQAANGGPSDAFVTKVNAAGSALIYSTYLGGNKGDEGRGIAVDALGNAYVTGRADSPNFPTANPIQAAHGGGERDAFVTKVNAAGSALVYSTYLGGSGSENTFSIAVDASGNTYVTGFTGSTNFPTANPLQPAFGGFFDAFVTKVNATDSALVYSTFLGGSSQDLGFGIAVDASGNAYVTGVTDSANFPTASPLQAVSGGGFDAFVAKIAEAPVVLEVEIDIKPGSFPNSISLGSGGTVPVAIFSTATFDATTVVPTSITLASAPVKLKGQGTPMAAFEDVDVDGLLDLVVHVETTALQLSETDVEAVLEGQTFDGTRIRGVDTVRVVP